MKKLITLLTISLFLVLSANAAMASDVKLTVVGPASALDSGIQGTATIKASPVSGTPTVAGAAFTLKYDSSLTITVDNAAFFDTFVNQGFTGQDGMDASGLVSGFDSPFVTNDSTASGMKITRIAAARKDAGAIAAGTLLFNLTVSGTNAGTYDIMIIPTALTNTAAGWNGENSDLLIGVDATTFPVRLAAADAGNPLYIENGSVTINPASGADTDGDGVADTVEQTKGTNRLIADTDGDGYPDGVDANPLVKDAAGGANYNKITDARVSNLDVDLDGVTQFGTDGILVLRYMSVADIDPAMFNTDNIPIDTSKCGRCSSEELIPYIQEIYNVAYDVDGDGAAQFGTDGILVLRYMSVADIDPAMFNIDNIPINTSTCVRCTAEEIKSYIQILFP